MMSRFNKYVFLQPAWRDAGVVDRGGLENRCTLTGTKGSNPFLSAQCPFFKGHCFFSELPIYPALCIIWNRYKFHSQLNFHF